MEESSRVQSLGHKDAIFPPSRYRRGGAGFGSTERRVKAQAATARAANGDHDALTGLPVLAPLAERAGLIGALGAWVLQQACETAVGWDVLECLRQWKELGVRIAVDDFGTGYSSLSYLSRLPVDRLKLDKSLIHSLTTKRKDAAIVRSIIALGKDLDVSVIAEGVETEQQFQMLQDLGCLQVQGYLLGRPGPPEDVQALLRSQWGVREQHAALRAGSPAGTAMVLNRSVAQL